MFDILRAVGTAAGILLPVLILITVISFTISKRAERATAYGTVAESALTGGARSRLPRRMFFSWVAVAWASFTASMLTTLGATSRFMFPNVLFEPPLTFKAGPPEQFKVGEVDQRFKQSHGVWLVKDINPDTGDLYMFALSDICTHLGCIPNWLEEDQKFKCPCHGSGYYKNGINFEGPTPRPLERFAISLADDGQVFIDKNLKFQQEKGQWTDPRSFLLVTS